jgi:tRNA-specific 2-thiouridylase
MISRKNKKIVVSMSGGVDSSVAAAILKKGGWDVIGVTFRMWPKEECGSSFTRACCSLEAITRARVVAEELKIPYYVLDFSEEFRRSVIDYFCEEYLKGRTPNPCVICNEKIKFGLMMEKARSLGADLVATGHYVKTVFDKKRGRYLLKCGKDRTKDQSYFLFRLSQNQLKNSVFPLGDLTKDRVRSLAKKMKLKTFNTVSSQDVCFVQDMQYAEYIRKKAGVEIKTGEIVDKSGKVLGSHKGLAFYTIGQRRGLGIAHSEPLYVIGIDVPKNRLIAGKKKDVLQKALIACDINWIAMSGIEKPFKAMVKIRYNHKGAKAVVAKAEDGCVSVDFETAQEAPTPGQAVVFYDKDVVLGGGWIK